MNKDSLTNFLAHSVELETEARNRYKELSETMATHNNEEVAAFFKRMVKEAKLHLKEVSEIADGMNLPEIKSWEFEWPDGEAPEAASYEDLHYLMTLRQAMELALKQEHSAERYYRSVAESSDDPETVKFATMFADEELSHAAALKKMIAALPEDGSCPRVDDDEPHMPA